MNHLEPVMRVEPIEDESTLIDQLILEKYADEIEESIAQAKRGEVHTSDEIRERLGIPKKRK